MSDTVESYLLGLSDDELNDAIEQAKADWDGGAFGLIPDDDQERIPLPA